MNPFFIAGGSVRTFTMGLREPFITAAGRKDSTTNVEVLLRLRGGCEGRGEASGSVVLARQKPPLLAKTLRSLLRRFTGADVRGLSELSRGVWREAGSIPAAAAAFECAAAQAHARSLGLSLAEWFGGALKSIETDCTLSAASPAQVARSAARAAAEGFRRLKVKIGRGGFKTDLGRLLAADRGRIRGRRPFLLVDGNQGLSRKGSMRLMEAALKRGLRSVLLEQPMPRERLREYVRLRKECPVPLAADESVRTPEDAARVLDADAFDIINIKVGKSGLERSLDIMAAARAAGKGLMIGCMQESALGLAPSVHLACGTGLFSHADLDSDVLLAPEQPRGGFVRRGRFLRL